jgi:hypothetical protein
VKAAWHSYKARAFLVSDPDANPDLVALAEDLLVTGGTGAGGFSTTGGPEHLEANLSAHIGLSDAVVLLRTDRVPSREVLAAHQLAREAQKPVHALAAPGITVGVTVDEMHEITLPPSPELIQWAATFAQRFGHPTGV